MNKMTYFDLLTEVLETSGGIYNSIISSITDIDKVVINAFNRALRRLYYMTDWNFKQKKGIDYSLMDKQLLLDKIETIYNIQQVSNEADYIEGQNYFINGENRIRIKNGVYKVELISNCPVISSSGEVKLKMTEQNDLVNIENIDINEKFCDCLIELTMLNLLKSEQDPNYSATFQSYRTSLNVLYEYSGYEYTNYSRY